MRIELSNVTILAFSQTNLVTLDPNNERRGQGQSHKHPLRELPPTTEVDLSSVHLSWIECVN